MRKIAICDDSKLDRQLLKVVIQTMKKNLKSLNMNQGIIY